MNYIYVAGFQEHSRPCRDTPIIWANALSAIIESAKYHVEDFNEFCDTIVGKKHIPNAELFHHCDAKIVVRTSEPLIVESVTGLELVRDQIEDDECEDDECEDDECEDGHGSLVERKRTQSTEDINKIWRIIEKLQWRDADEIKMTKSYIKNKLTPQEIATISAYLDVLGKPLVEKISLIVRGIDISNTCDFYAHIIGKGKQFYDSVLKTPDLCIYLSEVYQPLYTYLLELVR